MVLDSLPNDDRLIYLNLSRHRHSDDAEASARAGPVRQWSRRPPWERPLESYSSACVHRSIHSWASGMSQEGFIPGRRPQGSGGPRLVVGELPETARCNFTCAQDCRRICG